MNLVKVGSSYINMDQVTEIRDTGVDIEIYFSTETPSTLRGADADRFRAWLKDVIHDLNPNDDEE